MKCRRNWRAKASTWWHREVEGRAGARTRLLAQVLEREIGNDEQIEGQRAGEGLGKRVDSDGGITKRDQGGEGSGMKERAGPQKRWAHACPVQPWGAAGRGRCRGRTRQSLSPQRVKDGRGRPGAGGTQRGPNPAWSPDGLQEEVTLQSAVKAASPACTWLRALPVASVPSM